MKLGKVIVLTVPEGFYLPVQRVAALVTKHGLGCHDRGQGDKWLSLANSARLVDLDAMERHHDDCGGDEHVDEVNGYNAALRDVAGKGG